MTIREEECLRCFATKTHEDDGDGSNMIDLVFSTCIGCKSFLPHEMARFGEQMDLGYKQILLDEEIKNLKEKHKQEDMSRNQLENKLLSISNSKEEEKFLMSQLKNQKILYLNSSGLPMNQVIKRKYVKKLIKENLLVDTHISTKKDFKYYTTKPQSLPPFTLGVNN